jgi:hypothetical protein
VLATAAGGIASLNATPYVPDSVDVPCFYLADDVTIEFDHAMGRGLDLITLTGVILANTAMARDGQSKLDSYLAGSGSSSIKATLNAIRPVTGSTTLTAVASDLRVIAVRSYRRYEHAGIEYYGAEFEINVWGAGAI